jgi:hypothetical protein
MSPTGKIQIVGVDGVDIISGGKSDVRGKEIVTSSKEVDIRGAYTQTVKQDHTSSVGGSRDTTVSASDTTMIGVDQNLVVSRDVNETVNGKRHEKVLGGLPTAALPGFAAYELELVNGGITYILGDPLGGANPLGMQSMNVLVNTGGVNFGLGPLATGNFNVISTLPGSVNLGASGTVTRLPTGQVVVVAAAPFSAMMLEPFNTMMTALLTWLDTHTHVSAVGPSTPPVVPSSPIVQPLLPLIGSLRVKIGL